MKELSAKELKALRERLGAKKRHAAQVLGKRAREEEEAYAEAYREFISKAKTEREAVRLAEARLKEAGFRPHPGRRGRRIYWTSREKCLAAFRPGKAPPTEGLRLIAAHIDAPRLDLKLNPLYEELELAFLKTHYYGGIKKFHWVARPLALHGVVLRADGTKVEITIGEEPGDPVFTVNDLLPHLAGKVQGEKPLKEAVPGEKLNVLFGGTPLRTKKEGEKDLVKLRILRILSERYGLSEEDLVSAELELVPAGPARYVGLDRAFIGGYGQDDRSAAFAALEGLIRAERPEKGSLVLLLDKEEIGSDGNTGAKSRFLELVVAELLESQGIEPSYKTLLQVLVRSEAISADVTAGIDPDYQEVHDRRNDALIGHGICLTKYTGARGKYSANDAHAEFVGRVRRIWERHSVVWQAGELGKVDEGGGGTVAKYLAYHGMDVVDAGPPLLSMHSPFEIAHRLDLYMTWAGYRAFFEGGVE